MPPNVAVAIELSEHERAQLEAWTRRRTSAQALAQRARIVLLAAEGLKNTEIADQLGVSRNMAMTWRARFAEYRLDGLLDEPRPGRPRTITDDKGGDRQDVGDHARDATHWSTRSMAREVGLTQSAVLRIWKAFGLQPHRQQTWKLSKDPQFIDKVRDVVGLYLNPPERAVVLCVDEKSQIQALDRTAPILPILPMLPGVPERATHDYKRAGTSSLYAALDLTTGKVIGRLHSRHRAIEFKRFLATLDREVPDPRRAPRARQLLHAQDAGDPEMAGRAPQVRPALHPDQLVLAQPRRALVCRTHQQAAQARRASLGARAQHRHPRIDRHLERRPTPVRVDPDRRPDPRLDHPLLRANQCITTLDRRGQHDVPEAPPRILDDFLRDVRGARGRQRRKHVSTRRPGAAEPGHGDVLRARVMADAVPDRLADAL